MRYHRQQLFSPIGHAGQAKIRASSILICGCGALGTVIAERLVRAGVGTIRLVDRDWVELSNLQRQALFTEAHAQASAPKAPAAAEVLSQYNCDTTIEPVVDDLTCDNIQALAEGCDLILDGTDNFETRFLINDYSIRYGVPWIHGGCLGASGQVMTIVPGRSACFRCLVPELPPAEAIQSCDTAGVLGSAVGLVGNWQAAEAIKILSGNIQAVRSQLVVLDSWDTDVRLLNLAPVADCPTCAQRNFPFLDGRIRTQSVILCGKNAVQLTRPPTSPPGKEDWDSLAARLMAFGQVQRNAYFVRLQTPDYRLTLFRGGRTVVEGTTSPAEAKSVIARTLGS